MNEKRNYHTHTWRCRHADGLDRDFVEEAVRQGYKELGFADHACWKYDSDYQPHMRMDLSQFEDYKSSVLQLKEEFKDKISIKLGMEAEFFPKYMNWLLDFCIEQDIDYLILGNHFLETDETGIYFGSASMKEFDKYIDSCIQAMKTGMYSYLAHPELPMRSWHISWNKKVKAGFERLIQEAAKEEFLLEYNVLGLQANIAYGQQMYPHEEFWKLAAKYGCKAIIGMDAHCPDDLSKQLYDLASSNLEKLGVEVVSELPLPDFRKIKEENRLETVLSK